MINPFSTPRTPEEWRARARVLQRQLEGLSIDELMRGAVKQDEPSGPGGHGYDPNQPRVPAGHPDGGRWTNKAKTSGEPINDPRVLSDATPDNHWIVGADYAAGHHYHPRSLWQNLPLRQDTRDVLDRAVSGPLAATFYNQITGQTFRHRWDKEHREYNQAVNELFQMYFEELGTRGITPERMTPDHAWEFIRAIYRSQDPRIRNYLARIRVLRRVFRLRGNE